MDFPSDDAHRDASTAEDDAQFGLVDVIEAFIAMRHESRNQSRESRELAESLQHTSSQIADLENKLLADVAKVADAARAMTADECSLRLAETIVEIDKNVSRAVAAMVGTSDGGPRTRVSKNEAEQLKESLREPFIGLGFFAKWFCKSTIASIEQSVEQSVDRWASEQVSVDPTFDGLKMLVRRIQTLMADQQIERIETESKPFDAEMMNAVEAVETCAQPRGHVVEQLSAAYRWRGKLIRFAEVRVSK